MADARRWIVIGHLVLQWHLTMEWALMVLEWRSTAEEQFGATAASEATKWQFALGLLNTMFQTKWRSTLLLIAAISAGECTKVAIRFGLARHVDQSQAEFDIITDCSIRECESDKSGNSHWA